MRTEAGDVGNGLADVGLSDRASWLASAVLYGSGGVLILAMHLVDPSLASGPLALLACAGLAVSAACGVAAWRLGESDHAPAWQLHARLVGGLAIWTAGLLIEGPQAIAFSLLPLFSVLTPCYLYSWRMAIPYALGALAIVVACVLVDHEPARTGHAIVLGLSTMAIAAFLMVTRERMRVLAGHNRRLAYTDPLTRLANMRALRERITQQDRDMPFALLALDLDNFKRVNDTLDHGVGDRVLCAVAASLCGELEASDLAARRGGDEFAVILAHPHERDVEALLRRVEDAVCAARAAACPAITPTVSIGHVLAEPGEDPGHLLARADDALHEAKARSRAHRERADGARARPCPARAPAPSPPAPRPRATRRALDSALRRSNPTWFFTALVYGGAGVTLAGVSVAGLVAPLSRQAGGAIGAALLLITIACLKAAGVNASERWQHVASLAAYGLIAVAIGLAGRSGTALLALLPAIGLYGFLMFEARVAALYALAGMAAFAALALVDHVAFAVARIAVCVVVMLVVSSIVARLRTLSVDFARRNRELSEVDGLTGVGNLRALRSRVGHIVRQAQAAQATPLLVAVDLDEFKQVNDRHSHTLGDEVLVAVARALDETVRVDDLVARRGGDEFVVVVDDAASVDCDVLCERIDTAIRRARLQTCPDVRPSASIAPVRWQPGDGSGALLRRADAALHEAKRRAHAQRRDATAARRRAQPDAPRWSGGVAAEG